MEKRTIESGYSPVLSFILRFGLFELLFLTPLIFYGWATTFSMTKETFAEISCLVLFCGIMIKITKREIDLSLGLFSLPVAIFGLWLLASVNWSQSLYLSLQRLGVWGSFFLVYFLSRWVADDEKWVFLLLTGALLSGFLAAAYSICQFYGVELPIWRQITGRMRIFSTFGNPNYLASYLAGAIPLLIYFFLYHKRWRIFYLVAIGTLYTGLLITYTRGAWVALFFSVILTIFLILIFQGKRFFSLHKIPLILLLILVFSLTFVFSIPNPLNLKKKSVIERGASVLEFTSSATQRLLIWQVAVQLIKERPLFGWGIGTFGLHYPEAQGEFLSRAGNKNYIPQANRSIHAHNDYLEIWVETGIVGILLLLWVIGNFYRKIFLCLKKTTSASFSAFLIFITASISCFLIHATVSFPFHIVQNGMFFWLLMAISGKKIEENLGLDQHDLLRWCKGKEGKPVSYRFKKGWFLLGLVIVFSFYLGLWRIRIFTSDLHVKQAELLMDAGFYLPAKEQLLEAVKINPYNAQAYAYLTRAYIYLGNYRELIDIFPGALKGWNTPNIYNNKAFALLKLGKIKEAREILERGIYLYPNFAPGYINLGYISLLEAEEKLKKKNFPGALENLDRSLLSYAQAKIWQKNFAIPERLSYDFSMWKREKGYIEKNVQIKEISPTFPFYVKDKSFVFLLPPVAWPEESFLVNVLVFDKKSERNHILELKLEISKKEGEIKYQRKINLPQFSENPVIVRFIFEKGLPEGSYYARVKLLENGKEVEGKQLNFSIAQFPLPE